MVCSISAVFEGPVIKLMALGWDSGISQNCSIDGNSLVCSSTTILVSGRKLSVIGEAGDETITMVPVSAIPAQAWVTET